MPEWFVYDNAEYYPEGQVIEAPSAEEAMERASLGLPIDGMLVFPLSALAAMKPPVSGVDLIARLRPKSYE